MSWQRIELNMIPDTKVLPVVHASQFDSNRSISFQMFTGEDEWTIPEGLTIELHCRKVDDNIVTLSPLSVDGSVITFITTEQLTACSGQNKCELSFIDADDLVIGSLNFILDVEPDPLAGGVTSETAIDNLTQQIEDITQEVIGDDYYDKTEVDALLNDKADVSDLPDMSLYYTKTATDTLLNTKADKSNTYTKTQVDTALAAKANTADLATVATTGDYDDLLNKPVLPDMTQYYTKSEVNTLIDNIYPTLTASGDVATFSTALTKPLVSVTADLLATTIVRCGKNLLPNLQGQRTATSIFIGQTDGTTYPLFLHANVNYHLSFGATGSSIVAYYRDRGGTTRNISSSGNFSVSEDMAVQMWLYSDTLTSVEWFQLELGSTETAYELPNIITQPVADATTITTLTGVNNVFADAGSVTVQYKYMSI